MEHLLAELSDRLAALHETIEKAISGLPDEAMDWIPGQEMNSLAVLMAHTLGAERYWIGDIAGGESSTRIREAEFKTVGVSSAEFVDRALNTLAHSQSILSRLSVAELSDIRFASQSDRRVSVAWALLHALEHTALHAGHIEITRQIWEQRR